MKMALLAEEKNDKAAMKVYYSYLLMHIAKPHDTIRVRREFKAFLL